MKLLFVIGSLRMGGAQRTAYHLIKSLTEHGHQLKVVVTFSGGGEDTYGVHQLCDVQWLSDRNSEPRLRGLGRATRLYRLRRIIVDFQPERIISFMTDANLAALIAGMGLGIPTIVSERTYPPADTLNSLYVYLRRLLYRCAACVVMQTEEGAEWIRRNLAVQAAVVIPNPVVLPLPSSGFKVTPASVVDPEDLVILSVGRLVPSKGHDLVIRSFFRLFGQVKNIKLVILGEGSARVELEAAVRRYQMGSAVFMPGAIGNLHDWYRRADIFVFASLFEGFPNALAEALSYGCACVSFDCKTGPSDLIRNGRNGFLVTPAGDEDGLAFAIKRLVCEPSLREKFRAHALQISDELSIERVTASWQRILEDASHGRREEGRS